MTCKNNCGKIARQPNNVVNTDLMTEFARLVIGLKESARKRTATQLLVDLQKNIAEDHEFGEYAVTVSIGVSASKHTDTPDMVIGRVDKGLYTSKEKGKNRITIV